MLAWVVFEVRVLDDDRVGIVFECFGDPGCERRALALIFGLVDRDGVDALGELVDDLGRVVTRPVIDEVDHPIATRPIGQWRRGRVDQAIE